MEASSILEGHGIGWVALDALSIGFLLLFWVLVAETMVWVAVPTSAFIAAAAISLLGYVVGRMSRRLEP